jgi:hypothetical protein
LRFFAAFFFLSASSRMAFFSAAVMLMELITPVAEVALDLRAFLVSVCRAREISNLQTPVLILVFHTLPHVRHTSWGKRG